MFNLLNLHFKVHGPEIYSYTVHRYRKYEAQGDIVIKVSDVNLLFLSLRKEEVLFLLDRWAEQRRILSS